MELKYTQLYKTLSEVSRRRILAILEGTECSVQDLQDVLSLGQSSISAHLAQLRSNRLVDFRRKGRFVLYRLALGTHENIDRFLTMILEMLVKEEWYDRDARRLKQLLDEKAELSFSFYEGVETQNKRSPGQTDRGLAIGLLRTIRNKTIVDIGCGVGRLSKQFAKLNKKVIGIDADKKQIDIARKTDTKLKEEKVTFIVGLGECTNQPDESTDLVLFSHSLHHIKDPSLAIKEAVRILKNNGMLIILDLKKHEEYWMRKIYGDVHLGFDIQELEKLLIQEGVENIVIDIDASDEEFSQFENIIVTATKK